jgi:hypothetical protein
MVTDTERLDKLERIEAVVMHRHWYGVTASGRIIARPRKGKEWLYHSLREAIDAAPEPGVRKGGGE